MRRYWDSFTAWSILNRQKWEFGYRLFQFRNFSSPNCSIPVHSCCIIFLTRLLIAPQQHYISRRTRQKFPDVSTRRLDYRQDGEGESETTDYTRHESDHYSACKLPERQCSCPSCVEETTSFFWIHAKDYTSQPKDTSIRTKSSPIPLTLPSLAWAEPEMLANGPPSAVIGQCPGTRALKYSTTWYRSIEEPAFFYPFQTAMNNILQNQSFSSAFLRFRSEAGIPLQCRFWVPRMSVTLPPDAMVRGIYRVWLSILSAVLIFQTARDLRTRKSQGEGVGTNPPTYKRQTSSAVKLTMRTQ
jgi:hypothetical protein